MNPDQFSRYLEAVDHPRQLSLKPDEVSLHLLYREHITRFPYQNIDLYRRGPVVDLSVDSLLDYMWALSSQFIFSSQSHISWPGPSTGATVTSSQSCCSRPSPPWASPWPGWPAGCWWARSSRRGRLTITTSSWSASGKGDTSWTQAWPQPVQGYNSPYIQERFRKVYISDILCASTWGPLRRLSLAKVISTSWRSMMVTTTSIGRWKERIFFSIDLKGTLRQVHPPLPWPHSDSSLPPRSPQDIRAVGDPGYVRGCVLRAGLHPHQGQVCQGVPADPGLRPLLPLHGRCLQLQGDQAWPACWGEKPVLCGVLPAHKRVMSYWLWTIWIEYQITIIHVSIIDETDNNDYGKWVEDWLKVLLIRLEFHFRCRNVVKWRSSISKSK